MLLPQAFPIILDYGFNTLNLNKFGQNLDIDTLKLNFFTDKF